MEKYVDMLFDFVSNNGFLFMYLVSGILNLILRFKTAEEWVSFCEANPSLGFLVRAVRAVGLDPVKVINSAVELLEKKAQK